MARNRKERGEKKTREDDANTVCRPRCTAVVAIRLHGKRTESGAVRSDAPIITSRVINRRLVSGNSNLSGGTKHGGDFCFF